jgi:hypothetical protein
MRIVGSPEVRKYASADSVTIRLRLEGTLHSEFVKWFRQPSNHEYTTNFMPEMCHVDAQGIEFTTTEAASRENIGRVRKWIDLANAQVSRAEANAEREANRRKEAEAATERARQSLQDELKDA